MRRDWDMVRDILLEVEALEHGRILVFPGITREDAERMNRVLGRVEQDSEYCDPVRLYHAKLLIQGGFVEEADMAASYDIHLTSLTWSGYDLLDSIRDDGVWKGTKNKLLTVSSSVSLNILKDIADNVARDLLGL